MATDYLEKAAEIEPSNAVISDYLGDAYWFGDRKNEARFQWKHALTMKDDSGELIRSDVKSKIENGIKKEPSLSYDKNIIEEQIKLITKNKNKTSEPGVLFLFGLYRAIIYLLFLFLCYNKN